MYTYVSRVLIARISALIVFCVACIPSVGVTNELNPELEVKAPVRTGSLPVAKARRFYRIGDPYVIAGRMYTPREEPDYRAEGVASWYGDKFHGRLTANGEVFDTFALSAAHPTLPLPSYVRVTNLENRRSIVVRLNDRGPFHDNRLIDVSVKTAKLLGFYEQGLAKVQVDYIGPAELEGSDDEKLETTFSEENMPAMAALADIKFRVPIFVEYPKVIFD